MFPNDRDQGCLQVIPQDQGFRENEKYAGIFHFRFWFGRWIEIVIDDRIPIRKGHPIYMKSASNVEIWPTLLEKAYAKAKGSYELLNHWLPIDGCIELTGIDINLMYISNITFALYHSIIATILCMMLF
jgi:hypothetical protein